MQTGLERLLMEKSYLLTGSRIGLLTNQSAVNANLEHAIQRIRTCGEGELMLLFAPEHGLYGVAQDQAAISKGKDPLTGLPLISLYGDTEASLSPSEEDLAKIDILIFDIQDVGVRYYTFIYTLALAMKACKKLQKKVIVLDRPNPINGITLEGNLLDPAHASFVGLYPIPVRHGMTVGELATLFNEAFGIGCELTVVEMKEWKRAFWFDETKLPWVLPSPNMPTLETATVYAGSCLLEGTNMSEGRGTTRPFEIIGAPWINDPARFAQKLSGFGLPGVKFRPLFFQPTFHKWKGELCGGVQIHVTERKKFRSFATGLCILIAARFLYPDFFQWRREPYEFGGNRLAFDMLCGTPKIREAIEEGESLTAIEESFQQELEQFWELRKKFLLYSV